MYTSHSFVINSCCTVVGHKNRCYTAEEVEHMDMGPDPVPGPLVHECFDIRVLAVSENAYEQPAVGDLTGIRIDDVCGVSRPVNLDLFARLSGDVHSCTAFLLIPADVFAELGIHEGLFAGLPAFLAVFDPQKLFGNSVPQQFLADMVVIGQTSDRKSVV